MDEYEVKDEMRRLEELQDTLHYAFTAAEEFDCIRLTLERTKLQGWRYEPNKGVLENLYDLLRSHPGKLSIPEVNKDDTGTRNSEASTENEQTPKCRYCGNPGKINGEGVPYCNTPGCTHYAWKIRV